MSKPDISSIRITGFFFLGVFVVLVLCRVATSEWLYVYLYKKLPNPTQDMPYVVCDTDAYRRAVAVLDFGKNAFSSEEVGSAVSRLLYPERSTPRISHTFQVAADLWPHTVVRTIRPALEVSSDEFVALHRPAKGDAADQFTVEVDGKSAAAIGSHDGFALTGMALTTVYMWLRNISYNALKQDVLWCSIMTAVLSDLPTLNDAHGTRCEELFPRQSRSEITIDNGPRTPPDATLPTLSEYVSSLEAVLAAVGVAKAPVRDRFLGVLKSLFRDQIIWAKVGWEPDSASRDAQGVVAIQSLKDRILGTIGKIPGGVPEPGDPPQARKREPKQVVVQYTTRHAMKMAGRGERQRIRFGLVPKNIYLGLPLANEAISYHLEMELPAGMYVYSGDARLVVAEASKRTVATESQVRTTGKKKMRKQLSVVSGSTLPVLRSSPLGSNLAHVYVRDIGGFGTQAAAGEPQSSVMATAHFEFRERPPGILLAVGLLAGYLCALVWVIGVVQPGVFSKGGGSSTIVGNSFGFQTSKSEVGSFIAHMLNSGTAPSTGWATILFGVPAILSAWIVSKFSGEQIAKISLASFFAVAWCIFNAAIMVFLALVLSVKYRPLSLSLWEGGWWIFDRLSGVTIADALWPTLMVSCAANVFLIASMVVARIGRYSIRRNGNIDKIRDGLYTRMEKGK